MSGLTALLCWLLLAAAADLAGRWNFKAVSPDGEDLAKLTVVQKGEKITGSFESSRGVYQMEGTVEGSEIRFTVRYTGGGESLTVPFHGTIEGDKMTGKFQAGEVAGSWSAERGK